MSKTSDLNKSVSDHASDLAKQAQATAKAEATARAAGVKDAAAKNVQTAADAAHAAAQEFDPNAPQAQAIGQVADHVQDIADRIRTADLQQLAMQATVFARRYPLMFIGGATLAGFAAARFLKARDPNRTPGTLVRDPWVQGHGHDVVAAHMNGGRTDG